VFITYGMSSVAGVALALGSALGRGVRVWGLESITMTIAGRGPPLPCASLSYAFITTGGNYPFHNCTEICGEELGSGARSQFGHPMLLKQHTLSRVVFPDTSNNWTLPGSTSIRRVYHGSIQLVCGGPCGG